MLKICEKCKEPLEAVTSAGKTVRVLCRCGKERLRKEQEAQRMELIERARKKCFRSDDCFKKARFEKSDETEEIRKAMNYAKHFGEMKEVGLLLYGNIGAGKSHVAACIANELIDEGKKVLMANITELAESPESFGNLNSYDLLILDDMGAERKTEYMTEQAFKIVDARYRAAKPMIITTNLGGAEINSPGTTQAARIYDRILERCHPIEFKGASRRRQQMKRRFHEMDELLKGEK